MNTEKKEPYTQPVLVTHELLRDNGGSDGVPGHSNFKDFNR